MKCFSSITKTSLYGATSARFSSFNEFLEGPQLISDDNIEGLDGGIVVPGYRVALFVNYRSIFIVVTQELVTVIMQGREVFPAVAVGFNLGITSRPSVKVPYPRDASLVIVHDASLRFLDGYLKRDVFVFDLL